MILEAVQNFGNFPDGRLRAGPFRGGARHIVRSMERYGLLVGSQGEVGACSRTIMGIMVSAAGPGVMGYLLDDAGLEAASSDLEAFLAEVVTTDGPFTIEGHHCPDETRMVRSVMTAWLSGPDLMISGERILFNSDGQRKSLMSQPPVAIGRPANVNRPQLSLVC
jgi:hypothetical protein